MTERIITRHPGLVEWLRRRGVARPVEAHLDIATVRDGDVLIGVLPPHLTAEACQRGARVIHLVMNVPPHARGRQDHTPEEMDAWGARLEEIRIETGPVPATMMARLREQARNEPQATGRNSPRP